MYPGHRDESGPPQGQHRLPKPKHCSGTALGTSQTAKSVNLENNSQDPYLM